jgi:tetratricopeptide (TPR) repeat protein
MKRCGKWAVNAIESIVSVICSQSRGRRILAIALLAMVVGCSASTQKSQSVDSRSTQSQASPSSVPSPSPEAVPASPVKNSRRGNPKAVALNNQAVERLSKGDLNGALSTFNQAIQTDARLAEAYLGRGIAYSGLRKRQAAIQNYNQAIKLDPGFAAAYLNRADEYATIGRREQAIADFSKAAQLFSQRGDQANARLAQSRIEDLKTPLPAVSIASNPSPSSASEPVASSPQMALAMHLRKAGARMYGTYWCSVCNWQREQFGEAAFSQITYVECDPGGSNPQPDLCNQANIAAYPTWEINGRLYPPGGYPLRELANLSGYQGSHNFGG